MQQKQLRKKQGLVLKDETVNPYDSDEQEYLAAAEAEAEYQKDVDGSEEEEQKSYDSELEEEFFGKKDPEANGRLEKEEKEKKALIKEEQIDSSNKAFNPSDFAEKLEDVNTELRRAQRFKPASGVDFIQYDRFGYKIGQKEDEEVRQFIANEQDTNGFSYTAANDE